MVTQYQYTRVIAILPSLEAIGQAVDQLVIAGFPLAQIFLLGRDTRLLKPVEVRHPEIVPIKELLHEANWETVTGAGSNLKRGIMVGNFTGGLGGLLLGIGLLAVPGVGQWVASTLILYLLTTATAGTVAGGALGMLVSQGITTRLAKNYLTQIVQGNYLLVVCGNQSELFRAEHILYVRGLSPQQWI